MILTVTLNPAVDKTCQIARLLPGEVNRLEKTFSVAGGKGINVTKILRQFHLPAAAMGFLGGYTGRMIEDAVMELGAECHFTRIQGETRTNVNLLGADGYVTELLEPGPEISKEELANFKKEFEYCLEQSSLVVLSGSVPKGVPADIYGELAARCRAEGRRVILDTSGELLREGVKEKPYMIKPNKRELEFLAGCRLPDRKAVAGRTPIARTTTSAAMGPVSATMPVAASVPEMERILFPVRTRIPASFNFRFAKSAISRSKALGII